MDGLGALRYVWIWNRDVERHGITRRSDVVQVEVGLARIASCELVAREVLRVLREQQPEVLAVGAWVQVIRAQRTIRDDDLARAWNTGDRLITRGFVPAQVGCRPCPRDRPSATVGVRRGIFVSYLPGYAVCTCTSIFQRAGASVIGSGRFASHLWISRTSA